MIAECPLTFPLTYTQSYPHPYPYIKTPIALVITGIRGNGLAEVYTILALGRKLVRPNSSDHPLWPGGVHSMKPGSKNFRANSKVLSGSS